MKRQRLIIGEGGPKVPGYIVTFSDMVTLLLTFFVMLLSLSQVQDPELFDSGRDAFLESIRYIGLGMLFGKENTPRFGDLKTKHSINNPDESPDLRTLDARAEELRRIFEKLKQTTTIVPSQIVAERTNFSIANVHFSPGSSSTAACFFSRAII
ncbi:flagellar motor protein MotB, partial [Planctomycetota bacterium]